MATEQQSPYVISADFEGWGTQQPEYSSVNIERFRESLVSQLEADGKVVEWIEHGNIRNGLITLSSRTQVPKVSLDRFYFDEDVADAMLDLTRASNTTFTSSIYTARKGTPDLLTQFDRLGAYFAGKEVVLVDDVLFSGEMASYIVDQLTARSVKVTGFIAGIAIGEGSNALATRGVETMAHMHYPQVEDEVCERDFTAAEISGRTLIDVGQRSLYWVPKPYSDHAKMASIYDEHIDTFFTENLIRNIDTFGVEQVRADIADVYGKDFIEKSIDTIIN